MGDQKAKEKAYKEHMETQRKAHAKNCKIYRDFCDSEKERIMNSIFKKLEY